MRTIPALAEKAGGDGVFRRPPRWGGVEEKMIAENPVELESNTRSETSGAQPFEPEELLLLRENFADEEDRLSFLVFRWTGLRVSDVASLLWEEANLEKREIRKLTKK